jgi:hypothetical protein
MPRIRWKATLGGQDIDPMLTTTTNSIDRIQRAIGQFVPYNAGGAQQAVTTVSWPPAPPVASATTQQQHSEMVALGKTLAPPAIWQLDNIGQVAAINGNAIDGINYFTNLPHCGYCTIMLYVLSLPRGLSTKGRYNLAVNLEYTVPDDVFNNFNLLARLVNSNTIGTTGWVVIKNMINPFIQNDSAEWVLEVEGRFVTDTTVEADPGEATVLAWTDAKSHRVDVNVNHFGKNSLLTTLWKFIYQGIYDNCN